MRSRSRRLVVPAVLSVIVLGGPISAVELSCGSPVVGPDDAMLANAADATSSDGRDDVADAADGRVDGEVADAADGRVDAARDAASEVDAAVDAAPPDTPT